MSEDLPNRSDFETALSDGTILSVLFDLQFEHLSLAGQLFAQIHADESHDMLLWFQNLNWTKIEAFPQTQLMDILGYFCGSLIEAADRMFPFFCVLMSNLSEGNQLYLNKAFENWGQNNPEMLPEAAKFIREAYEGADTYAASLIVAWKHHNIEEALQAALIFSSSAVSETRRQSIFALGFFEFETATQATKAENRLVEIGRSPSAGDQRTALSAMARILEKQDPKSKTLIAFLETAANSPSSEIRDELIACLAFHGKGFPEKLRAQIFKLMKNVGRNCPNTIRNINAILRNTDLDVDRVMVFETLNRFLNQELEAPQLSALDSFKSRLKPSSHEVCGWYVISWLLEGRQSVCDQLKQLLPPSDLSVYDFDVENFKLEPAETFYLSRKIFAYFLLSRGPAVSLLCSCLMSLKLPDRKRLEVEIVSFWFRNYPEDMELFNKVCTDFPKPGLKASINRMRVKIEEYKKPLLSQQPNPALSPSERERRVQAELAHELNKEVTHSAQEKSFFASMFSSVVVLYGRSSVNYVHLNEKDEPKRQIIPFQTIKKTQALPRMNCLYPVWMNYLLFQYSTEKRPR